METIWGEAFVIPVKSRQQAMMSGLIVDATEFIKNSNVSTGEFYKVYMTNQIFEDILNLEARCAIDVFCDVLEFGSMTDHETKLIQHYHLPKDKTKIKYSVENEKRILDICYQSEDCCEAK